MSVNYNLSNCSQVPKSIHKHLSDLAGDIKPADSTPDLRDTQIHGRVKVHFQDRKTAHINQLRVSDPTYAEKAINVAYKYMVVHHSNHISNLRDRLNKAKRPPTSATDSTRHQMTGQQRQPPTPQNDGAVKITSPHTRHHLPHTLPSEHVLTANPSIETSNRFTALALAEEMVTDGGFETTTPPDGMQHLPTP